MSFFYLSRKYAEKNGIWIYEDSKTPLNNYKETYGDDCYEFVGKAIPNCPWFDNEDDCIIEMPEIIKIKNGIRKLLPGEYIESEELKYIPCPSEYNKGVWEVNNNRWVEGETKEEINIKNVAEAKKRFFKYFEAYQKISKLKEFNVIQMTDVELKSCLDFLNSFNPNKENVNIELLLKLETEKLPKILVEYLV